MEKLVLVVSRIDGSSNWTFWLAELMEEVIGLHLTDKSEGMYTAVLCEL